MSTRSQSPTRAVGPPTRTNKSSPPPQPEVPSQDEAATDPLKDALRAERAWARALDPESMEGVAVEIRMLRQIVRDAFVDLKDDTVRQGAEALRRLLRERAIVPEMGDGAGAGLEDGLSADLRRVLQRVGMEMGVDV